MVLFNIYRTCFKGQGSCIDLVLINRMFSFKHSNSYETGISDHHHLIKVLRHCSSDYKDFEYIFNLVLIEYAPKKKKVIWGNHKPHLNKELRKAIM